MGGTNDPEEWPDVEFALRQWLRADTDLQAFVGQRVFFGVPRNSANAFPLIMLTRIGGGQDSSEVPLDNALMQFDVYGRKTNEGGSRKEVTDIALQLRRSLQKIRGRTRLDDFVSAFDTRVSSQVFSPLPADDRPRILIVATVPAIYDPV